MKSNSTYNLISVVLWLGFIFFTFFECVPAQPTLKEQNRTKDFGKSLKNFEKKEKDNSKDNQDNSAEDEETIRVKTDLVVSDVLVVNQKGNVVLGLQQNDFVITEDGIPQKIEIFSIGENATVPRSIVLIADYSGSMAPYSINSIVAAKHLVDKLAPQDRMAIVTDDVELLVDFTKDKALLKKELDKLAEKPLRNKTGRSEQYTALVATLNEMFDEEDIRPIVILQSDGDELFALKNNKEIMPRLYYQHYQQKSRGLWRQNHSFEDILALVNKSRATIYSIIPGFPITGLSQEERIAKTEFEYGEYMKFWSQTTKTPYKPEKFPANVVIARSSRTLKMQSALSEIAELSGGYTDYIEKVEDGENVYSNIFKVLNNRYVIGYYPINEDRNGKRRNVKIEVKGHPEYIVMGRKTYLTPIEKK
jgi:VWFA-related protein